MVSLEVPPSLSAAADTDVEVANKPEAEAAAPAQAVTTATTKRARNKLKPWQIITLCGFAVAALAAIVLAVTLTQYLIPGQQGDPGPTVNLTYATYSGTTSDAGISSFKGMRYAAPPLGDRRWRAPVEPEMETGTTRAKTFGPICLATNSDFPNDNQDEDCLYVNVWAPADAKPGSKLPVWLFIQGGGYVSLSNANWDGEEVVKRSNRSIVFVNFNYRVGAFGFLAGDKVKKNGDLNVGLLDQRFVMQWIQKHIDRFGGDPNHVVIQGLSAGAGSVALHLTAHGGRDDKLFVGAIVQSVFFPSQPRVSDLEWQFDRLVSAVGCNSTAVSTDGKMACLRGKSTADLQRANVASPFPGRTKPPMPLFYWTPCVDGDLVRQLPYTMFEQGNSIDVPLIMGTVTDEGSYFAPNANTQSDMREFLHNNYPQLHDRDLDDLQARYPLIAPLPQHNPWFPSASQAYGEATFICPTVNVLDDMFTQARAVNRTRRTVPWSYRFDVRDDDMVSRGLGVPHTAEVGAVFGPDAVGDSALPSLRSYNAPVVPVVMDYWISFVRNLSPNAQRNAAAPEWQTYASGKGSDGGARTRDRLVIRTGNTTMEQVPAEQAFRCQFWKSLRERTLQRRDGGDVG